jgi:hypothetical protein
MIDDRMNGSEVCMETDNGVEETDEKRKGVRG